MRHPAPIPRGLQVSQLKAILTGKVGVADEFLIRSAKGEERCGGGKGG